MKDMDDKLCTIPLPMESGEEVCEDMPCATYSKNGKMRKCPNKKVKITALGDSYVGKTCMLLAYTKKIYPEKCYTPIVFENYVEHIEVEGKSYHVTLWDTAGQEDYAKLRKLSYPNTTCFLLCYSINVKESYENIKTKWAPELDHHMPNTPIILVGTNSDLRNIDDPNLQLISMKEGKELANQIKAECYLECSVKAVEGLDDVIIAAVRASIKKKLIPYNKRCTVL